MNLKHWEAAKLMVPDTSSPKFYFFSESSTFNISSNYCPLFTSHDRPTLFIPEKTFVVYLGLGLSVFQGKEPMG